MILNQYLELGVLNTLRVDRDTPHGVFLMAEDGKDVLLPKAYVTEDMVEDALVEVFLYTDSEDRLIATTIKPKAMLDEFALFEVVDVAPFGAFVDWGLLKDLFVPNMFQKQPFKIGESRFLKVVYDEQTHRLVGTEKFGDFFQKKVKNLKVHQEVNVVIISKTPLGYKCLVEGKHEGLIYHNEIFQKINLGDKKTAFIKNIRKDGHIDLDLRKSRSSNDTKSASTIIKLLEENNNILPYNYKSDATLIKDVFEMSKKEFKRNLTKLQDDNKIIVKDTGIYLL
jgi:predicted RNA-binding protein (virulence factor B family)